MRILLALCVLAIVAGMALIVLPLATYHPATPGIDPPTRVVPVPAHTVPPTFIPGPGPIRHRQWQM